MRIVVMGTGPFAVPTAERLRELGHTIALVVTRPLPQPAPSKMPSRPIYEWAVSHGLPIFEPDSINSPEALERLQQCAADLFFVCDYGQILKADCLSSSKLGGINLHGSILPRHRGAAPVQWTLLSGDKQAGVSVIHMTPGLDAGPVLAVRSLDILPDESAYELEKRLAQLGVSGVVEAIDHLAAWDGSSPLGNIQDRSLVTKAPRFSKQHGQLDFRLPAQYLVRLIRACQPWPGTFAELSWSSGKKMRVLLRSARFHALELSDCNSPKVHGSSTPEQPEATNSIGRVQLLNSSDLGYEWDEDWKQILAVSTSQALLLVSRLQPAGKREMTVAEFNRGHAIDATTRFLLPTGEPHMLTST